MVALKKLIKSKTIGEAVDTLPYGFFNMASFIICLLFSIYPFVLLFFQSTFIGYIVINWSDYRFYELGVGSVVLFLYLVKIIRDKRYKSFKSFANDNIPIVLFGVFVILMIISTVVNGFTKLSLLGNTDRNEGLVGYLGYFVYFLLAYINSSRKLKRAFLHILSSTATVLAVILIYETVTENYNYSLMGSVVFYNSNHYGYYLTIVIMVAICLIINEKSTLFKIIFSAELALLSVALLINNTLGAQLAIIFGYILAMIVYTLCRGKFKIIFVLPLAVVAVSGTIAFYSITTAHDNVQRNYYQLTHNVQALEESGDEHVIYGSETVRSEMWESTLNDVSKKAFLGYAADGTQDTLISQLNCDRCHNEYLQYAAMYGVPAALFYIVGAFMVFMKGLKYRKKLSAENIAGLCAAFAYLVSAFVGNSCFYTTPYLFIMLGMGHFNGKNYIDSSENCDVTEKRI